MRVIGISGEMYAGKTTAARVLEQQGFAYTRISEVIDDVLRDRKEAITRENQQRIGLELHKTRGQRWLCERAVERISGRPERIVIDGLRWRDDALYFRERYDGDFIHLDISAPNNTRRERAAAVGKLAIYDIAEHHPVESGVAAVGELADIVIVNDSDIRSFECRVADVIKGGGGAS